MKQRITCAHQRILSIKLNRCRRTQMKMTMTVTHPTREVRPNTLITLGILEEDENAGHSNSDEQQETNK